MHANARLIESFYASFARRDAAGMLACYHPEATFSDPVFQNLDAARARAMWRMLVERGRDLEVRVSRIEADDARGRAHWDATYTFTATGRKVANSIDAEFAFRDGLIVGHRDRFDLWRWAGMALGAKGRLLGWAPFVQAAIRSQAARGLAAYMSKHGAA
ncbi:MAG: nuclear transport factor 2 family protein [Burkholderiales bacterium]|jgi:ketosteroid isomerase-like protein|nr:nuclear transport factor 2 family protein [Burkholderiales bacterium]